MTFLALIGILYGLFFITLPILLGVFFRRIQQLEKRLIQLEKLQKDALSPIQGNDNLTTPSGSQQPPATNPLLPSSDTQVSTTNITTTSPAIAAKTHVTSSPKPEIWTAQISPHVLSILKEWLLGGNAMARIGVVVLFFGVAFLLKYTAERGLFPIELRLISVVLAALGLIVIGWRLQGSRRSYGLVLEGGGMGIVYLTLFAAINHYGLLSSTLGLVLMVGLVVIANGFAVSQNARSLAILATLGGFLAPVLISHGGNHVFLFSYYIVLDAGIFAIAWFKAWRELNLIGFFFTFITASLWGYHYYQPAYFSSTEPFLILFFLFYVAVPILYAHRQRPQLKGYLDSSLIFGVPLTAFGLQSSLVADFEYGLAMSALAVGFFYGSLANTLRRRKDLNMLMEAFYALAIAFITLAIPLAVDGRWTGAAWTLEGAALVWVGVRQQRCLARLSGVGIQVAAGIAFLVGFDKPATDTMVFNSLYLGGLMLSLSGLISGFFLYQHRNILFKFELHSSVAAMIWGLGWWFAAGFHEIWLFVAPINRINMMLIFVALSCAAMALLSRRLGWRPLSFPPLGLLPTMIILNLWVFIDPVHEHPLAHWGFLVWPLAFIIQYGLLWCFESHWPALMVRFHHRIGLYLALFLVTWETAWVIRGWLPETWPYSMWGLIPSVAVATLLLRGTTLNWPIQRFKADYLDVGLLPVVLFLALWVIHASVQLSDPQPLPYLLLLNPLESVQMFALVALRYWMRKTDLSISVARRWYSWAAIMFIALNGCIARVTHFWGGVPFTVSALWDSARFQATLSIVWTLLALSVMITATRFKGRTVWLTGSGLLGVVVVKLFLVDLINVGALPRIVAFLVVGLLILITGYFSPLPPQTERQ
jgi:uncharacterized membrane protein